MPQSRRCHFFITDLQLVCPGLQSQEVLSALTLCTLRPTEKGPKCPKPRSLCVREQELCLANGAKCTSDKGVGIAALLGVSSPFWTRPSAHEHTAAQPWDWHREGSCCSGARKGDSSVSSLLHLHNDARGTQLMHSKSRKH